MDEQRELRRSLSLFFGILLAVSLVHTGPASADSFTPGCNEEALRDAVASANTNGMADTITLDAGCTYVIAGSLIVTDTNELTIVGNGATIDGSDERRVFRVDGGTLRLLDVSIEHGNSAGGKGGGIANNKGVVTLIDSRLVDNRALDGGGAIFNELGGSVVVRNSTISGNTPGRDAGGAVHNNGRAEFLGSVFSNNACVGPGHGGGAIFNNGGAVMNVVDSTFTNNNCQDSSGGAIANKGELILESSTLSDNRARWAGAVYNTRNAQLIGVTISSNDADVDGGGIYNAGHLSMTNSTLSGNSAAAGGGGVYQAYINDIESMTVLNSTVTDNAAESGGGIFLPAHAKFTATNTIVSNDTQGGNCAGPALPQTGSTNNLSDTTGCGPSFAVDDPKLGPLADNGGPTHTHALLSGSAAIDKGDNGTCPAADQRDVPRARTGADPCDIGAFEALSALTCDSPSAIVGTTGNDTLSGTAGADLICGLEGHDAIDAGAGDDIVFGHGGNDTLLGADGNDTLRGHSGNDTLWGQEGDDIVRGHSGNDTLLGHVGADSLVGHGGNDTLDGGPGSNSCVGGPGLDFLEFC